MTTMDTSIQETRPDFTQPGVTSFINHFLSTSLRHRFTACMWLTATNNTTAAKTAAYNVCSFGDI